LPARDAKGSGGVPRRWRRRHVSARSGKSAGHFRLETVPSARARVTPCRAHAADCVQTYALQAESEGLRSDSGSMRRILPWPASRGEACPGPGGIPAPERSRPHAGCVRTGRPIAGGNGSQGDQHRDGRSGTATNNTGYGPSGLPEGSLESQAVPHCLDCGDGVTSDDPVSSKRDRSAM
jgi:hypothetical protein